MAADMFSGWGIRTMSSREAGYNPIEYHNGTVWPHDTAIVAEGLRRYGFRDDASRVVWALIEAAEAFEYRLPEVFAGYDRDATAVAVEYPTASRPQAWAAAAPLLAIRTILGLDAEDGRVTSSPSLPPSIDRLRLLPTHGGGRSNLRLTPATDPDPEHRADVRPLVGEVEDRDTDH